MWPVILYPVGLCCMIISYFGFSFYLWYLYSSQDHVQNSLLNNLYGYMSLVCMGGGLTAITVIILLAFPEGDQTYVWQLIVRAGVSFVSALAITFLLITFASALRNFRPSLYLDISLRWRNKVAMPVLVLIVIFTENMLRLACDGSENISQLQCELDKKSDRITIPATVASFLGQAVIVVDDLWGWRKILKDLRGFCFKFCDTGTVAPAPDLENNLEPAHDPQQELLFKVCV